MVDASQGVEGATVANCYTAIELGVEVVPVLNKIDLPSADPDRVKEEIEDVVGVDATDAVPCSAKTGQGSMTSSKAVVAKIPPPATRRRSRRSLSIAGLTTMSAFVMLVRVFDGTPAPEGQDQLHGDGRSHLCEQVGVLHLADTAPVISAGQVGFVIAGIKELIRPKWAIPLLTPKAGSDPTARFKEVKPQVFAGLYPVEANQYEALREALEKLKLNDASPAL